MTRVHLTLLIRGNVTQAEDSGLIRTGRTPAENRTVGIGAFADNLEVFIGLPP